MKPVLLSLIQAYVPPLSPAKLFAKLDIEGNELPVNSTAHVALIDYKLGLLIDVRDDRRAKHREAPKVAAETDLFGLDGWRLPDEVEGFRMCDRTRYNPAVDPSLYPNAKSGSFMWTSTVVPEYSDDAFAVYFGYGYASWDYRGLTGVVRAVRSLALPAGQ